ncbi:hypothetical protein LJC22_02395 [Desulfosarcina sp. OttesenSCG-928-G10]|nr:hypothetical protein [Desulfosarcina sp. OttesenSCG-928-G10]MDL2321129.1 hypothetical protein [Desulfosarcina sp. OttesenSCG-928-B08]
MKQIQKIIYVYYKKAGYLREKKVLARVNFGIRRTANTVVFQVPGRAPAAIQTGTFRNIYTL